MQLGCLEGHQHDCPLQCWIWAAGNYLHFSLTHMESNGVSLHIISLDISTLTNNFKHLEISLNGNESVFPDAWNIYLPDKCSEQVCRSRSATFFLCMVTSVLCIQGTWVIIWLNFCALCMFFLNHWKSIQNGNQKI